MTDSKLKLLVAQAVRLDRAIVRLQEKLKALKSQIAAEAETRKDEQVQTEGGGTSIVLEGAGGCIARVTESGRALKSSLKTDDKAFAKIKAAAGQWFTRLFTTEVVHKPIENFREQAMELLGESEGKKLIKLCENNGKTTVSFETKEIAAARA
jgi:hypothetical protein